MGSVVGSATQTQTYNYITMDKKKNEAIIKRNAVSYNNTDGLKTKKFAYINEQKNVLKML